MAAIGATLFIVGTVIYLAGWTTRLVARSRHRRGFPTSHKAERLAVQLRGAGSAVALIGAFVTGLAVLR